MDEKRSQSLYTRSWLARLRRSGIRLLVLLGDFKLKIENPRRLPSIADRLYNAQTDSCAIETGMCH